MRSVVALLLVVLAACSDESTAPSGPWAGRWAITQVNAFSIPGEYIASGQRFWVVSRTLTLFPNGTGLWADSTLSGITCPVGSGPGVMCNASGSAAISWTAEHDILTVLRNESLTVGYVVALKTFEKQPDGTLRKNDDGPTEIYRRQ